MIDIVKWNEVNQYLKYMLWIKFSMIRKLKNNPNVINLNGTLQNWLEKYTEWNEN